MCNAEPSSPTALFSPSANESVVDLHNDNEEQPPSEGPEEIKAMGKIFLYLRAMISMFFLRYLGEFELVGGSLAIGFANIIGYSVISGLALGMEPRCRQAYAEQRELLGLTLQGMVLLLLSASIPISFAWLNMKTFLLRCGQDQEISSMAHTFILFSVLDLFFLSLIIPLRIYLKIQSITLLVTYSSAISLLLHVPLNFLLVVHFKLGLAGVAIAMVWTNLILFLLLASCVYFSCDYNDYWVTPSADTLRCWSFLLALAVPTCALVCLQWWWYEFMILLCGQLVNPKVACTGILIQATSLASATKRVFIDFRKMLSEVYICILKFLG